MGGAGNNVFVDFCSWRWRVLITARHSHHRPPPPGRGPIFSPHSGYIQRPACTRMRGRARTLNRVKGASSSTRVCGVVLPSHAPYISSAYPLPVYHPACPGCPARVACADNCQLYPQQASVLCVSNRISALSSLSPTKAVRAPRTFRAFRGSPILNSTSRRALHSGFIRRYQACRRALSACPVLTAGDIGARESIIHSF